jgi:hypothetical protein
VLRFVVLFAVSLVLCALESWIVVLFLDLKWICFQHFMIFQTNIKKRKKVPKSGVLIWSMSDKKKCFVFRKKPKIQRKNKIPRQIQIKIACSNTK